MFSSVEKFDKNNSKRLMIVEHKLNFRLIKQFLNPTFPLFILALLSKLAHDVQQEQS